jgi:hypothetical protein
MIYFFFRKVAMAFRIPATVSLIARYIHGVLLWGSFNSSNFVKKGVLPATSYGKNSLTYRVAMSKVV